MNGGKLYLVGTKIFRFLGALPMNNIFVSILKQRMAYTLIFNGSRRKVQLFEYTLLFFTCKP
jgi:hypothetical protein